jgi:hypothetical protein
MKRKRNFPKFKKRESEKVGLITNMPFSPTENEKLNKISKSGKIETPIDEIYERLKKEDLKLSKIMEDYNLEKKHAMEWCKLLVDCNLAKIEIPIFGEPILRHRWK